MTHSPAVSIYIVTYMNAEDRGAILRRTCEAALGQHYTDFEVVVSDNGGTYSAHEALKSITDPRLNIFRHSENVGFGGNINRCLELCQNDLIKPLCDDDLIHPDFLTLTVPYVTEQTLVTTRVEKYTIGQEPDRIAQLVEPPAEVVRRARGYSLEVWNLSYSASSIPSATLFSRKLFQTLEGYDVNTITSDWDFLIEVCLEANLVHLPIPLCYVGVWAGSLTEQMLENPYFYPRESLYTQFRVFHCKGLDRSEKNRMLRLFFKWFFFQSLRPLKHLFSRAYWAGYFEYARRFFKFLFQKPQAFGQRPGGAALWREKT